jgi:hypothetical protein
MAKRSRRARRRKRAPKTTARTATVPSPTGTRAETQTTGAGSTSAQGFAEQYAYVYSDLKRIAILAGSLLAVLVALSFVIR